MAIDPKPLQSAAPAVSDQVSQHVTVFRANQRHELSMLQTWAVMCRNIWTARELIWQLFKRDFLAGYKKSFLGLTWMFVQPIMGIIPWVFAWKANLYSPGEMDIPFPVYILVGKSMWGVFTAFYQAASATMDAGKALFQQVNFPHDALLIKTTASSLPGLFFTMVTILVVMMAYGVVPSVWGLALPLVMLPLFFLGAAMGLLVAMIRIVAFDLNQIITILMGFLMWTTPLLYSERIPSPMIQSIIKWNPLTYLVCSCRDVLIHGRFYKGNATLYFICAGTAFLLFLISWRLFYVSEDKLVERMV